MHRPILVALLTVILEIARVLRAAIQHLQDFFNLNGPD